MSGHCVVGSLSEYIAAIERCDLFHCISRGEQREFDHPLRCSIYRHDLDQYTRMLEQYHLDVETSISPIQDKNFLAFAQHHGLPTNLLDFSFSPLVSLYFCVDGCTGRGYVYFVRKEKLVNINKVLYDKPLGWGMFEELLNYDVDLLRSLLPQMSEVYIRNQAEMTEYFEHHVRSLAAACRDARELEIAGTAFDILMFLYNNPEYRTARDIVRVRGIKPSHVSVNVDQLVESGYLLREHNPEDRREYLLTLTPKAREAAAHGRIMQEQFFALVLEGVDEGTLQTVQQFFRTVERNMDRLGRTGTDPAP